MSLWYESDGLNIKKVNSFWYVNNEAINDEEQINICDEISKMKRFRGDPIEVYEIQNQIDMLFKKLKTSLIQRDIFK